MLPVATRVPDETPMASCYINVLTVHAGADEIDDLVARARGGGEPLRFGALVPVPEVTDPSRWMERHWGTGEPEAGTKPPVVSDGHGMRAASFTFSTLGGPPAGFAALLASAMPEAVVTLASVEPSLREASAWSWGGDSSWERTLRDDEMDAVTEHGADFLDPEAAMDRLAELIDQQVAGVLDGQAAPSL